MGSDYIMFDPIDILFFLQKMDNEVQKRKHQKFETMNNKFQYGLYRIIRKSVPYLYNVK